MDNDSSSKFIGSLTKFLQSLCNGYVDFQKGVELVGHIYLSIDTGEKVDYILHEKLSKNDENSVTFLSNSFHAQPLDKDRDSVASKKDTVSELDTNAKGSESDDDVMIVDQSNTKGTLGSTNVGTVPPRGVMPIDRRRYGGLLQHGQGSSNSQSSLSRNRQQTTGPSSTVTSQDATQENINMGEMKLEQISSDELLSIASQVGDGASSAHVSQVPGHRGPPIRSSRSLSDTAGQPVWIKQEAPDDAHGGPDTGWAQGGDGHSDSSNSSSNLYPVMMHQNPSYSSGPVFPGFPSTSSSSTSSSQHHGFSQSLPGMSGASNPYANRLPGSSQNMSSMDPAASGKRIPYHRLYRERLKQDPVRYRQYLSRQLYYTKRYQARKKREQDKALGDS